MSDNPLPPLPPEALEHVHTSNDGAIPPRLSSFELNRASPEFAAQIGDITAHLDALDALDNNQNMPSSSPDAKRAPRQSLDGESNGHDSNGGRSSLDGRRSPRKLAKAMRKEIPQLDEFMVPPPRISSKSQQGHGSPASNTRRSLEASQELNPTSYPGAPGLNTISTVSSGQSANSRSRPPRTAPLDEPINQRENPEWRPRSQHAEQYLAAPGHQQQQQQIFPPQHQYSQSQQWPSHPYPDQDPNMHDADGFYGNTVMPPYARQMNDSPVYAASELQYGAPTAILDQSHLQPGNKAALLSNEQSMALYRANAKKSSNPDIVFEFAAFMLEASKSIVVPPADSTYSNQLEIEKANEKRENYVKEALQLLKKIADRGHVLAEYTLADCYSNGIGTPKGRQDFDRAFPLFQAAAKHNHVDAAYRAGTCCEYGWGTRKESAKAVHFYRSAASQKHPGAMFRLGQAEINGELGLSKNPKEGVKWLKRSAENATAEFPHALHELALCHEKGIPNVVFVDLDYAAELLGQAAELGYAPSAFRLGECYEYGTMGCQADPALSIHYYVSCLIMSDFSVQTFTRLQNIAAQQNHRDACFSLTAWYLVGSPGVLPQSDTEAFLWAKRAADAGLAKAQYAVGYFFETGLGTPPNQSEYVDPFFISLFHFFSLK